MSLCLGVRVMLNQFVGVIVRVRSKQPIDDLLWIMGHEIMNHNFGVAFPKRVQRWKQNC